MLNSYSKGVLRWAGTGQRIYKDASTVKEFYLRNAGGREPAFALATAGKLAVYDMTTNKLDYI